MTRTFWGHVSSQASLLSEALKVLPRGRVLAVPKRLSPFRDYTVVTQEFRSTCTTEDEENSNIGGILQFCVALRCVASFRLYENGKEGANDEERTLRTRVVVDGQPSSEKRRSECRTM